MTRSLCPLRTMMLGMAVCLPFLMTPIGGCAKHADFIELRDELHNVAKTQEQLQSRQQALERRLQEPQVGRPGSDQVKVVAEGMQQRMQELASRLADLEHRLARVEDGQPSGLPRVDETQAQSKSMRSSELPEGTSFPLPGTPSISPTSAFNLAYNDYLNGRYDLAVTGFQRFLKDFPNSSLVPNAHYWLGESYASLKDFSKAAQAFQRVVTDFPKNEKVAPALFKLGVVAAEAGDVARARGYLRRVIEEYSTSDEAKLAKNKLADLR